MFDLVAGLPLHPLVVHAVVVLLPLAALAGMLAPVLRIRGGQPSELAWSEVSPTAAAAATAAEAATATVGRGLRVLVAAQAVVFVMTVVAVESGEALEGRLRKLGMTGPEISDHAGQGKLVAPLALAVLLGGAVQVIAVRWPRLRPVAVVLPVLAGLAAIGWTVVVGHSGAQAVWSSYVTP